MPASNATFFGTVDARRREPECVYKPVAGERPLWDFPDGTLADREVAAYVVSEALGWDVVPPTVLRDGPHGAGHGASSGSEPDAGAGARSTLVAEGAEPRRLDGHVFDGVDGDGPRRSRWSTRTTTALRRMAVFDVVVNNADRKGGHVLAMTDGHRYGVDHGVTFHAETSCARVLWGWAGEPLDRRRRRGRAAGWPTRCADGEPLGDALVGCHLDRRRGRGALAPRAATPPAAPRRACRGPRGWPAIPWPAF